MVGYDAWHFDDTMDEVRTTLSDFYGIKIVNYRRRRTIHRPTTASVMLAMATAWFGGR